MSTPAWPLSAVATELLRRRPVGGTRAVVLTLQELVVVGTWRTRSVPVGGSRRPDRLHRVLEPGERPAPQRPPLPVLHARLRPLVGAQVALAHLGPRLAGERLLGRELVGAAQDDLLARGLLRDRRGLLDRSLLRTTSGDLLHTGLEARLGQWQRALRDGGRGAQLALDELSRAPGLVPLLQPSTLRDVERVVRERRDDDGAPWLATGDDAADAVRWSDLDGLDGGLDGGLGGLDSSVSEGGGGGSDGGDGGGGGGGD